MQHRFRKMEYTEEIANIPPAGRDRDIPTPSVGLVWKIRPAASCRYVTITPGQPITPGDNDCSNFSRFFLSFFIET